MCLLVSQMLLSDCKVSIEEVYHLQQQPIEVSEMLIQNYFKIVERL